MHGVGDSGKKSMHGAGDSGEKSMHGAGDSGEKSMHGAGDSGEKEPSQHEKKSSRTGLSKGSYVRVQDTEAPGQQRYQLQLLKVTIINIIFISG